MKKTKKSFAVLTWTLLCATWVWPETEIDFIKRHLIPITNTTLVTNRGLLVLEPAVPGVVYRVIRYDTIIQYKTVANNVISVQSNLVRTVESVVTNIETKIVYQEKISSAEKKKAFAIGFVLGAGVVVVVGTAGILILSGLK